METLNLSEVAKEQVRNGKRRKKEEKATAGAKRRKSAMAKFLFKVILLVAFASGVYWFSCNYKLRTPIEVKIALQSIVVKRIAYAPIAYTDDILLTNDSKTDKSLGMSVNGSKNPQIASIILGYFGFDEVGQDFIAIFTAESGLNPKAVNYNCEYQENGKMVSRSCSEADRGRAWSVDCGIAQLNFAGTKCPETAFDPMWNVRMAKIKFDRQGRNAWVSSWDDNYKKYLVKAE
jgi:hypothetical protein